MLQPTRRFLAPVIKNYRNFATMSKVQAPKQFVVVVKDFKDPECLQRRLNSRENHLSGALSAHKSGLINLGGPLMDNHETRRMEGSFLVVTAESTKEVEDMIIDDPYYKNKVWEKWEILPVNLVIGKMQ